MSDSSGSSIWGVIPGVFYDIIGRIVPGFVLLATVYVIVRGPGVALSATGYFLASPHTSGGDVLCIIVLLVVAGYLLAMLLSGVGRALRLKDLLNRPFVNWRDGDDGEIEQRAAIKLHLPDIEAGLSKIRAERAMCEVLLLGWTLIGIGYPLWCRASGGTCGGSLPHTEAALATLAVCAYSAEVMHRRNYITRLKRYYDLATGEKPGSRREERIGTAGTRR